VTNAEVEAILKADKVITSTLRWSSRSSAKGRLYLEARVLAPDTSELLDFKGVRGKTNYSYALLWRGVPIRKATLHFQHTNPDGQHIGEPHKHRWDENDEDGWAYVPDDMHWDNPDQALLDFLAECKIRYTGTYQFQLMPRSP